MNEPGQRTRLRRNYGTIFMVLCIPPSTSDHSSNSVILRPSPFYYPTCLTRCKSNLSNLIQRKTMVGVCPKSFAPGNEKLRDPEVPLPRFLLFYPRKTKAKKTSRKEKEKTNKKGGDFKSEGHFVREQVGSPSERVVKLPEHRYAFVLLKRIKSLRLSRAIFRSKPSKNLPLT